MKEAGSVEAFPRLNAMINLHPDFNINNQSKDYTIYTNVLKYELECVLSQEQNKTC